MLAILIILIGSAVTLNFIQRQFIYFPTQQDLPKAELQAKQLGLEPWLHEGQFIGWKSRYPDGKATGSVLVLHGNAGAAITQLQQDSHKPVLLVGESLGTVVAAIAGSRKPETVQGMLLVTPFPNLPVLAKQHYPWVPAWFLHDRFRADEAIAAFHGPVAILVAGQDTVAPPFWDWRFMTAIRGSSGYGSKRMPDTIRWTTAITIPSGARLWRS